VGNLVNVSRRRIISIVELHARDVSTLGHDVR
jgi:hypothetical protein